VKLLREKGAEYQCSREKHALQAASARVHEAIVEAAAWRRVQMSMHREDIMAKCTGSSISWRS